MKLSQTIQVLLEAYADQPITIAILLDRTGSQGFGVISAILTLPLLIPLPLPLPGFSTVLSVGTILMGLQMACGWQQPHLPPPLARWELSPAMSQALLKNLSRILHPIEQVARPRLFSVSRSRLLHRVAGLCLFWNALLMALPLPIPFTNLLPAYSILVLAIGVLETDGFLLLMGYGMTLATTFFFISLASLVWNMILHIGDRLLQQKPS